ncbi:uncharacterized protein [Miscanthus floridulus]|uniref:uncharacterized protein isoform X2 n=1 Tax=Miscanthus floridulus TaxID=154761 RepID=UPI003458C2E6
MALYFPICASCIGPITLTQMQEAVVFVFLHLCQLFPLDNKICYFTSNIMDVCEGPHQACQTYWPRSTHYHSTTKRENDRSKKISLMTSKSCHLHAWTTAIYMYICFGDMVQPARTIRLMDHTFDDKTMLAEKTSSVMLQFQGCLQQEFMGVGHEDANTQVICRRAQWRA